MPSQKQPGRHFRPGVLRRVRPMRLRVVKEPFDNAGYVFELEHDGFRALVYVENGECRLLSRNLKKLPLICSAANSGNCLSAMRSWTAKLSVSMQAGWNT